MMFINLQERFGKQYCNRLDPSFKLKGYHRGKFKPWTMQMPCLCGVITGTPG